MSKEQTSKSTYRSKYAGDGFVTPAQYITELICEKLAKKNKKTLTLKFWENEEWSKFYRQQIIVANGLLKIYSDKAIVLALNSKKAWSIYSLRAPHLDPIIQEEEAKIKKITTENIIEVSDKDSLTHRKTENKPSVISKLRKLDNG